MGTVYNRGTKHAPRWWVGFLDADGVWKYRKSNQPTKELARRFLLQIESNVADGRVGIEPKGEAKTIGPLLDTWATSLTNRNAKDDRSRMKKHVRPVFAKKLVREVTLSTVMHWLDAMKTSKLSGGSRRHNLNILSRFFAWCIERGYATVNPVRMIPQGRRPAGAAKKDAPYLDDEKLFHALVEALPSPIDLMFFIANRCGLRTGEVAGLRLGDFAWLDEGTIRIAHSYDGPLKEDTRGEGKIKWAPAPLDTKRLATHLKHRHDMGAGDDDFVFDVERRGGRFYRKEFIEQAWEKARDKCEIELTWYQATRHSFVSRNLAAGASLDEVSAAVGHSSPVVTKRFYDHFVRKHFPKLRS